MFNKNNQNLIKLMHKEFYVKKKENVNIHFVYTIIVQYLYNKILWFYLITLLPVLLIGRGYWLLHCSWPEWAICFDLICDYSV